MKNLWVGILVICVILIIFHRQLDWSQIFDPKYWINKKLNLPFKKEASKLDQNILRPLVYIEPDKIEYSNWSEREKLDDPEITTRCEKIILHFWIHNNSKSPASNIDIKATSFILQDKNVSKFSSANIKNYYEHNLHLIIEENPGRQPFVLALDKKAVKYFNEDTIKVKLIVNVKYNGLNDSKKYWSESAFIYSPTFEKHAKEIYSKGN